MRKKVKRKGEQEDPFEMIKRHQMACDRAILPPLEDVDNWAEPEDIGCKS